MATDYFWKDELIKRDGRLYIRSSMTRLSEPLMDVLYWPVGRCDAFAGETFPLPARRVGYGTYAIRREPDLSRSACGYDAHFTAYLTDGGNTAAECVETAAISRPKVRKGIETRWRNGRWEKHLKAEGWVAA